MQEQAEEAMEQVIEMEMKLKLQEAELTDVQFEHLLKKSQHHQHGAASPKQDKPTLRLKSDYLKFIKKLKYEIEWIKEARDSALRAKQEAIAELKQRLYDMEHNFTTLQVAAAEKNNAFFLN